jgi:hypothetical protein
MGCGLKAYNNAPFQGHAVLPPDRERASTGRPYGQTGIRPASGSPRVEVWDVPQWLGLAHVWCWQVARDGDMVHR